MRISDAFFGASEVLVNQKEGQGACRGDSGGPAFLEINGEYFLWGITSRGVVDTQRLCNAFAAYTNLFAHSTWMNRMIGKLSKPIVSF
ncbi:Trypsin [compost metagenome]